MVELKELDLHIAFDEVEGNDDHVNETAAEDSTCRRQCRRLASRSRSSCRACSGRNEDIAPPCRRSFKERPALSIIFSGVVEEDEE